MSDNASIRKLISSIRKGNTSGHKTLFRQYYAYVMSICLRYMRNEQDAEEVLNDTFVKIFAKIEQYRPDQPFTNWIAAIAVNSSIDHLRKAKNQITFSDLKEDYDHQVLEMPHLAEAGNERILPLIQELPPQYRLVFNLYVFEDYKHEEIAQKLGISVGTSKSNYSRAKKIMREKLARNPHYQTMLKSAI